MASASGWGALCEEYGDEDAEVEPGLARPSRGPSLQGGPNQEAAGMAMSAGWASLVADFAGRR